MLRTGIPRAWRPSWTEEKLAIVACYLGATRSGWYALDLFAGVGLNISETTGGEIPGSPLIARAAVRRPRARVLLCERSAHALLV